jgi:hypothetical protein
MQSQKGDLSFNQEIQRIADKIKTDVEKELNQVFNKFQVVEHQSLPQEKNEPERTSYSMKVKTNEDDQSHLRLQTTRRDPFSDWVTSVDELFRGRSPFESMLSTFDPFRTGFGSIQKLADSIKNDVERELNRSFETFDVMEHHPILTDPEHTSYYMRVKTDDNGHVRVKTMKKEPKSDWQTHVEEYYKGKPALESSQKNKSIENASLGTQSSRTEQKGGRDVMEVEQNTSSKATKA